MGDGSGIVQELSPPLAQQLAGFWVSATLGDATTYPLTPLAEQLSLEGADALAELLESRGASLPRRSRRLVRVEGHVFHAFKPLERAARELSPSDAEMLAFAIACEALPEARQARARRRRPGLAVLATLGARLATKLFAIEQRVLLHEQDASQHYRWLAELDLGILPDDALNTTLDECAAAHRAARILEVDVAFELYAVYAALFGLLRRLHWEQPESVLAAALVPDALTFPSSTPALVLSRLRASDTEAEFERARRDFLAAFGERGPGEADPFAPRWAEAAEWLAPLALKLSRRCAGGADPRPAAARKEREAALLGARQRAGFVDARLLQALTRALTRLVLLRSRVARVRARCSWMLRTVALDVDRRLFRLVSAPSGTAFFLRLSELFDSTVRPEPALLELSAGRRRQWQAQRDAVGPTALLGRDVAEPPSDGPLRGVGVGVGVITGQVTNARQFEQLLTPQAGGVLVVRSLDPSWAPAFSAFDAIVADTGGLTDEGVLVAASLGVPLLLGTRTACRRFTNGQHVRVDLGGGTVDAP